MEKAIQLDQIESSFVEANFASTATNSEAQGYLKKQDLISDLPSAELQDVLSKPHNLERPLAQYYISSSHNSFQDGGQVFWNGEVSTEAVAKTVQQGAASVELDVFDGKNNCGSSNEPVIYHADKVCFLNCSGGVLKLSKVLRAVKEALPPNHLPFIFNIENNMTEPKSRQTFMRIFREVFPNVVGSLSSTLSELPSPASLRGRILIRSKPKSEDSNAIAPIVALVNSGGKTFMDNRDEGGAKKQQPASWSATVKIEKLVDFDPEKATPADMIPFLNRQLTRIYPGNIADSDNYNPVQAWSCGAQLAVLNWQNHKAFQLFMDVNRAMFRRNGGCGWVLKPEQMLDGSELTGCDPPRNVKLTVLAVVPTDQAVGTGQQANKFNTGEGVYVQVGVLDPDTTMLKDETVPNHPDGEPVVFQTSGWSTMRRTPIAAVEANISTTSSGSSSSGVSTAVWADVGNSFDLCSAKEELGFVTVALFADNDDNALGSTAVWMPALAVGGLRALKLTNSKAKHVYTIMCRLE
jgi:phosphatidylinositol phospholipase C delta